MQYIDSAMVGNLGVNAAASVGLMASCMWLFGGFCSSASAGFSVQAAHLIGAKDFVGARKVLRQGITALTLFSLLIASIGMANVLLGERGEINIRLHRGIDRYGDQRRFAGLVGRYGGNQA